MSSQTRGPLARGGGSAGQRCADAGSPASATVPAAAAAMSARRLSRSDECFAMMIPRLRSWTLRPIELHHLEGSASKDSIRMPNGLAHFVMIVAARHDKLDRLASSFQGLCEVARLTLEFRRLQRPVR